MKRNVTLKGIIRLLIICLLSMLLGCTAEPITDNIVENTAPGALPNITELRSEYLSELSSYLDDNSNVLTDFAQAFLAGDYTSAEYDETGVNAFYGENYIRIEKDDLPQYLMMFYRLDSPPFACVSADGSDGYRLISDVDSIAFITQPQGTSDGVSIDAWLCYGEGIAYAMLPNEYYYTIINDDWVLYFNYDEDSMYYEQFDLGND